MAVPNIGLIGNIIACPGGDFCDLANAVSIPVAAAIHERFESLTTSSTSANWISNIGLHQRLRSPPRRSHRHPRRRQARRGVVPRSPLVARKWLPRAAQTAKIGKIIGPSFARAEVADVVETSSNLSWSARARR